MKQRLHLKAPGNWINDPNGFIYYKGKYHMFYQHFPYEPRWGTMHWGHAISDDMVNWEHLGIALYPTKKFDQNGCFSGSAISAQDKLYVYYTGIRYLETDPEDIHVSVNEAYEPNQVLITSEDGFSFDNAKGKQVVIPTIEDPAIGHRTHARDPKVWKGKEGYYIILGTSGDDGKGKVLIYKSDNLTDWTYVSSASKTEGYGWMWECPDYFETEGGGALIISAMGLEVEGRKGENQTLCMGASYDEESCELKLADSYQFIDYGMELYAPQSTLDKDGNRTLFAWLRMPHAVAGEWNGMFCLPRLVEVKDGHIYFRVHPNVKNIFTKEINTPAEAKEGYCVKTSLEEGESVNIGGYKVWMEEGRVCTDRTGVFPDLKDKFMVCRTPKLEEGNSLEIYVDDNLIEIYANDGEYVLSNCVYGLSKEVTSTATAGVKLFTLA